MGTDEIYILPDNPRIHGDKQTKTGHPVFSLGITPVYTGIRCHFVVIAKHRRENPHIYGDKLFFDTAWVHQEDNPRMQGDKHLGERSRHSSLG